MADALTVEEHETVLRACLAARDVYGAAVALLDLAAVDPARAERFVDQVREAQQPGTAMTRPHDQYDDASDAERLTVEFIDRMTAVKIAVRGDHTVEIRCIDECQARDLASSVALLLADRIAGWRRVASEVPSTEERVARWASRLPRKDSDGAS